MRKIRNKLLITLCVMCSLLLSFVSVYAVDTNKNSSITIHYKNQIGYFSLYKVADVSSDHKYTVTDTFKKYKVDVNVKTTEDSVALVQTLQGYIIKDKISPLKQGQVKNTLVVWDNLKPGLYLVLGQQTKSDTFVRKITPMLVSIPADIDGQYIYDLDLEPKFQDTEIDLINKKVIKVWKEDNKDKRPTSVQIELYRDKKLYETITLNKENNWQYIWENLSNEYEWTIVEKKVPDHYTVTVKQDGDTTIVTNTYHEETPNTPDKNIPQTGQLWWPVPVLIVLGIVSFGIGCMRQKEE